MQWGIGWSVAKVVKECGSGINDQRPSDAPGHVGAVTGHRQHCCHRSLKTSLLGDFVTTITSFAARLYGHRCAKRKTEQVLAALQQNGEDA